MCQSNFQCDGQIFNVSFIIYNVTVTFAPELGYAEYLGFNII